MLQQLPCFGIIRRKLQRLLQLRFRQVRLFLLQVDPRQRRAVHRRVPLPQCRLKFRDGLGPLRSPAQHVRHPAVRRRVVRRNCQRGTKIRLRGIQPSRHQIALQIVFERHKGLFRLVGLVQPQPADSRREHGLRRERVARGHSRQPGQCPFAVVPRKIRLAQRESRCGRQARSTR